MDTTKKDYIETENDLFSIRLRELMQEKKISQKKLAEYLGITKQSVSLYVNGQRNPDIEVLKRICQYFKISSDYLLGLSNIKNYNVENNAINKKLKLDEETIRIIEGLSYRYDLVTLNDEQRKIEEQNLNTFLHIDVFNEFVKTCNNYYKEGFFELIDNIWGYAFIEELTKYAQEWVLQTFCQNNSLKYYEKTNTLTKNNFEIGSDNILIKVREQTKEILDLLYPNKADTDYILYKAIEAFKKICIQINQNLSTQITTSKIFKDKFEQFKELYLEQEKPSKM